MLSLSDEASTIALLQHIGRHFPPTLIGRRPFTMSCAAVQDINHESQWALRLAGHPAGTFRTVRFRIRR